VELRVILAVIVISGCTLCGKALAASAERHYRTIMNTIDALRLLRILIVERLEPLENALNKSGSAIFEQTARMLAQCSSVYEAWNLTRGEISVRGRVGDSLGPREYEALDALFSQLGGSGRAAQETAITACIEAFSLNRDEARTGAVASRKMYLSIGFLTGTAIVVLFI